MSISSEISRISGNISDSLDAVAAKGVTVPSGSTSDDLADLIEQIGGGAVSVVDSLDSKGGTIRSITGVDISSDTVTAGSLLYGITAHSASGVAVTGTIARERQYSERVQYFRCFRINDRCEYIGCKRNSR